ncbi:MAG: ABC transporter permease subunit [Chloroflexi bacterium]|nr:ABC transporter permease subunit [Chloroflexota bacterium]
MPWAVFRETLRRGWRTMLWWSIGIGLISLLNIVILPDVDALRETAEIMEALPPVIMQAFGGGDLEFMATPEGYLAVQFFSFILVVLAVYPVITGLNVTANDEDRGMMDVVMSAPLARWRLVAEKLLAYGLLTAVMITLIFLLTWGGVLITPALAGLNIGRMAEATFHLIPALWLVLAFTACLGVILRRRGRALGMAAVFVVGSYSIDFIGSAATGSAAESLRVISFYRYYDGVSVIRDGLNPANVVILLALTAVLGAVAVWRFRYREIGV